MMDMKISFTLVILAVSTAANVTFAKTTKRLADEAFANNDYAKAVDLYTELIEKAPSDSGYLSLGHAYYKLKDFQRAVQAYTTAAEIQKDSPQAPTLRYLANAQYSLRQYAEALANYHRAVTIDAKPNDTFQIALCYTNLNQWSQARAAILKYLDHSPFATPALELLAHIHLNSSNPQEAVAILNQIVNADPSNRHHLTGLANALTVANRYGEAIDILEYTLRAVVPGNLAAMQMLADLYTNHQKF